MSLRPGPWANHLPCVKRPVNARLAQGSAHKEFLTMLGATLMGTVLTLGTVPLPASALAAATCATAPVVDERCEELPAASVDPTLSAEPAAASGAWADGPLDVPKPPPARPGRTTRVSVATAGSEGNMHSTYPAVSGDGRYVAFSSWASSLVPNDTNACGTSQTNTGKCPDIFVHDQQTGTTERVSVASDGAQADGPSEFSAITFDGRYVAFSSRATNLVPGDTNGKQDVFVHDRLSDETERVSVATDGAQGVSHFYFWQGLSQDGRYVAFGGCLDESAGDCGLYLRDRVARRTELIHAWDVGSLAASVGGPLGGIDEPGLLSVSADGNRIVWASSYSDIVEGDGNGTFDIFLRDRAAGTTEIVSVATDGTQGNAESHWPTISADGRYVAFDSSADNLVPSDTSYQDVFVHDLRLRRTERVSVKSADGGNYGGIAPRMSADGRYVTFDNRYRIAIRDRVSGTTEIVDVASDGSVSSPWAQYASLSADGRYVAFASPASNLVPDDANGTDDIFVRDRGPATGIGGLAGTRSGGSVEVTGFARLGGSPIANAIDAAPDGAVGAHELGAELTGASLTYRPEEKDLLLTLNVTKIPYSAEYNRVLNQTIVHEGAGGVPGVMYGSRLVGGLGHEYEVRAGRMTAAGRGATISEEDPPYEPFFALYRCYSGSCVEERPLRGLIGATGDQVRISLPLEALQLEEGESLNSLRAFTGLGEITEGVLSPLDEMVISDADITIPRSSIWLAVVPDGTNEGSVAFDTRVPWSGEFSYLIKAPALLSGNQEIWARACSGQTCGTTSTRIVGG